MEEKIIIVLDGPKGETLDERGDLALLRRLVDVLLPTAPGPTPEPPPAPPPQVTVRGGKLKSAKADAHPG